MKNIYLLFPILTLLACNNTTPVQVGDGVFLCGKDVYKVVNNEVIQVGRLDNVSLSKNLEPKDFPEISLSYIAEDAKANLKCIHRDNILYIKLVILNVSNLRDSYSGSSFSLNLTDEYGFLLRSVEIPSSNLVGIVDDSNRVKYFSYEGQTEMSTKQYNIIKNASLSSNFKKINFLC